MHPITKTALAATMSYLSHYGAVKLYTTLCIPDGLWGILQGAVTTGSPICGGLLTVVSQTQSSYASIVTTALSYLFIEGLSSIGSSSAATPKETQPTTD